MSLPMQKILVVKMASNAASCSFVTSTLYEIQYYEKTKNLFRSSQALISGVTLDLLTVISTFT